MKFLLTAMFSLSLFASSAQAASVICEGAGGLQAQFRIKAKTLTVLYYGNSSFGDFKLIASTPKRLTFYKKPHNSNNGIPLLISIPNELTTGAEGTKANVSISVTPYNTKESLSCTVSKPGRQY